MKWWSWKRKKESYVIGITENGEEIWTDPDHDCDTSWAMYCEKCPDTPPA